jgi:hypothetical protein
MTQLEKLMKLGMTEAEAKQVIEDDKRIDRGEKMDFDLTAEQEKATRKYRQADRKETVYKFQPRERKANEDKRHLIHLLEIAIGYNPDVSSFEVTNPERQVEFVYNGVRYRIVLSAPRK